MITIFSPLIEWLQGADNPDTVTAWSNLAKSHLAAGRPNKAIPLYRRTLGYCLRELGAKDPSTLRARNNLAMAYQAAGRTNEAIPLLERTVAGCERLLGPNHRDTVKARNNLAMCYRARANGWTAGGQRCA